MKPLGKQLLHFNSVFLFFFPTQDKCWVNVNLLWVANNLLGLFIRIRPCLTSVPDHTNALVAEQTQIPSHPKSSGKSFKIKVYLSSKGVTKSGRACLKERTYRCDDYESSLNIWSYGIYTECARFKKPIEMLYFWRLLTWDYIPFVFGCSRCSEMYYKVLKFYSEMNCNFIIFKNTSYVNPYGSVSQFKFGLH